MFSAAVELQVRPTFSGGKRVLSACRAFTFLTNNRMTKVFKMNTEITPALVREFFNYDPNTGVLTWRERDRKWFTTAGSCKSWNNRYAGRPAGNQNARGYIQCRLAGKLYYAHRLAWLYTYGEWPDTIDHINGMTADNRASNLRNITQRENVKNLAQLAANTSGVTGVSWSRAKQTWLAMISVSGKNKYLGRSKDFFEAVCLRKSAENVYGFHRNHGRAGAYV